MLNVFASARHNGALPDGYESYTIAPADLYPPTIAHIRAVLASGSAPDGALRQEYDQAVTIPDAAWDAALDGSAHPQRAAALTIARRWYTESLHRAVGGPIHLHITRDLAYKR